VDISPQREVSGEHDLEQFAGSSIFHRVKITIGVAYYQLGDKEMRLFYFQRNLGRFLKVYLDYGLVSLVH